MSGYKALYRKYRPLTFDDVAGQEHISQTLKNSVKTNRISHAYLFCGTRGTGKTSTAKILARAVNCENPQDGNPCNECRICRGISDGSILDVYEMDAASNSGVNNIREIREEVIYAPAECRYKVYIIDEAHMLSDDAFNALLKTLEEPPPHVIFILATTEPSSIIPTVLSRCQRFDFGRIPIDVISKRIEKISEAEGIKITPDAAELVAELADGSMRDCLSILQQCAAANPDGLRSDDVAETVGIVNKSALFEIADYIKNSDAQGAIKAVNEILNKGKEVAALFEDLLAHFRCLILCKATDEPAALLEKTEETAAKYAAQAESFSVDRIIYSITCLGEYLLLAKKLSSPAVAAEIAALKLCSPEFSNDTAALSARVEALEKKIEGIRGGALPKASVSAASAPAATAEEKEEELPAKEHTDESRKWDKWPEAIKKIKEESKTLYVFLMNAEALYFGDEVEIVLSNDLAYEKIATAEGKKYLSALFSKIQGEALEAVVSKKGRLKDRSGGSPSVFDIALKKDLLGDKMTVKGSGEK